MASPIAHASFAICLVCIWDYFSAIPKKIVVIGLAIWLSILADLDLIFVLLRGIIGQVHREVSHSILFSLLFSLLWAVFVCFVEKISWKKLFYLVIFGFILYSSHLVIDMFTQDLSYPHGIQLILPWSQKYFIFPRTFFLGIDYGLKPESFITMQNLKALLKEIIFFMIPAGISLLYLFRRSR